MSPTVPRDTVEGRAYNDLKNLAKRDGRDPAEYFTLYALEGFLARLALSESGDELVLKGGVLMAAYSERRPTRDIDLAAKGLPNDIGTCEDRVRSIAGTTCEDGLSFDLDNIRGETIRDESDYSGTRVHVMAKLASATLRFHVDLNFGDPINPKPTSIVLPLLLGGEIRVVSYPIAMVLAEKIVTAVDRGTANTRWRDFLDIARIAETQKVDGGSLAVALETVGAYRHVGLQPLSKVLEGMGGIAQARWAVWRRKQRLEDDSPESFDALLDEVTAFTDPSLEGRIAKAIWDPDERAWA